MKNKLLRFGLLASMILGLFGCTTLSGSHEENVRMEKRVAEYKAINVQAATSLSEAEAMLGELKKAVTSEINSQLRLASKGKREVASDGKELLLKLKVVDYNKVSWFSRMSFGNLAGDDKLVVEAEVVDAQTQAVIGSFTAKSVYRGDIFNNGLENVIKGISNEVVKYFKART